MEETNRSSNFLSVPVAIVIAGALIAGAVIVTNSESPATPSSGTNQPVGSAAPEISLRPISATDHVLGNPNATLAIVEFSDTECPFCKNFHTTMHRVIDTYGKTGKVLWVYRHFPLDQLHPLAPKEAEALECAAELGGNTGFWNYTDTIYEVTPSNNGLNPAELHTIAKDVGLDPAKFKTCLDSGKHAETVRKDYEEAVQAGGRGTPFSVLMTNKPLTDASVNMLKNLTATLPPDTITVSEDKKKIAASGALPYSLMQKIIDTVLAN